MTVTEAIKRAFRLALSERNPGADEINDAFDALNTMLATWSAGRNAIHALTEVNKTLVASTASYTIGSGDDIDTPLPNKIVSAFIRSSNTDLPLQQIDATEFDRIFYKSTEGIPEVFYFNRDYSTGTITLFPVPDSAYTLYLKLWSPLSQYANKTANLDLPQEYEEAIIFNLAARLCPEYGRPIPQAVAIFADTSFDMLKALNAQPVAGIDANPIRNSQRYSVLGDTA